MPNETSSSTGQATQSQGTRGAVVGTRRGIQRQPIVWDPSSRPQGTSSVPPIPGRGMHGARPPRGPRSRRPGRGMYGSGRGIPRGGPS